jgi:hypothetical protein
MASEDAHLGVREDDQEVIRTDAGSVGERSRGSGSPRSLALAVTVVLLLGVVALASRQPLHGSATGAPVGSGTSSSVTISSWELVVIAAGAAVALVGLLAYVGLPRRRIPEPFYRQPPFKASPAVVIAVVAPLLVGVVLIAGAVSGSHRRQELGSPGSFRARPAPAAPAGRSSGPVSGFELPIWVPVAVLALVVTGTVALIASPGGRRAQAAAPKSVVPRVLEVAVERSLADLATTSDPRRAVIAAYARMERSLAEAGLPRAAAEAPREYLSRASAALEFDPGSLNTLTTLFERARFSLRSMDESARDEAIAALGDLREELA